MVFEGTSLRSTLFQGVEVVQADPPRSEAASCVACNLCGADDPVVVFEAGRAQSNRIVRCARCGLMYGSPRIVELDLDRVARFDPGYLDGMLARDYDPRMDKESFQVIDWDDAKAWLAQRFPSRGRLLEVGCGLGFLSCHFQRDGWRVEAPAGC